MTTTHTGKQPWDIADEETEAIYERLFKPKRRYSMGELLARFNHNLVLCPECNGAGAIDRRIK